MTDLAPDQCFWVVPNRFLAGNYPSDRDPIKAAERLRRILNARVSAFVDLTQRREPLRPYEEELEAIDPLVVRAHLPIRDMGVPQSSEQMRRILDFIDAEMARGGCVYLHCWGGHGRTGTVVGCWLRRQGLGPEEALDELRRLRTRQATAEWQSEGPQTAQQFDYIRNWSEAGS